MAQPQRPADVHQDELYPPNKCYALMDANKKIDLNNLLRIFHPPQATDNNHERFVAALKFLEMVPFFLNTLDYAELLWEGLHYALKNPSTQIPYPRFTKLIVGHYMTIFPEISHKARDKYHNLEDDAMVKNIFNSGKHKDSVGIKIPSWMITDEMKLVDHHWILRIPQRRSTRLTPPTPIPTTAEDDDIILQDTIQLSLTEQKSHDKLEAKQNVQKVEENLIAVEIKKLVEGAKNVENVEVDSSSLRQNDNPIVPGTRLEPRSYKESPEVEITTATQPVNVNKEEEESVEGDYELRKREKGKQQSQADVAKMITDAIQQEHENLRAKISSQINDAITNHIPSQDDLPIWLTFKYKFERLHVATTPCRPSTVRPRDQDDPHDDAHPGGRMMHKDRRHLNMEPLYSYATDDDELPTKKVSQKLVDEMSQTVDEAKLHKVVNEMLRQRCTSGHEHQYYNDQMQNFLKNDIVWKRRKEILVSPHPQKPTPVVQSCQRDPKAPALSLVNQDLLYLKKGSSSPEKIVMSLHKFPAVIFLDDDIEERTSRWVDKCVKKFNPYARYNVEHWKNPFTKIFYINKQRTPGKPKEEIYSNSKIVHVRLRNFR
ncbi:hypothetical protein Tco_1051397 [Tanacetum coccineum]